jgi:hypothetical protein
MGRVEFLGEGEGLPAILDALLHTAPMANAEASEEWKWRRWIGVRQ